MVEMDLFRPKLTFPSKSAKGLKVILKMDATH